MIKPYDYIYLGKAYAQLGDAAKVSSALDKAIAISDSTKEESIRKVYDELIATYEDAEQWAEAGGLYQEKTTKFDSYRERNSDLQSMAIAYTRAKDFQKADGAIAQLIEKEPEFVGAYVMRAQIHAQDTSDFAAAKPYYEKVISVIRSEEHTSELQSLMRISYAVFCLKKKKIIKQKRTKHQ